MKNRNPLSKPTLLFAVLLTLGAARVQADILPGVSISFAPVGLTMNQTARLTLCNTGVRNGRLVNWRFIDASGLTLAQSLVTLPLGKIVSVDFRRPGVPLPPNTDPPDVLRAGVRAQRDIVSAGVPSESLRRSLAVFDTSIAATRE